LPAFLDHCHIPDHVRLGGSRDRCEVPNVDITYSRRRRQSHRIPNRVYVRPPRNNFISFSKFLLVPFSFILPHISPTSYLIPTSSIRHAPRRARDLPSNTSPQASHDVQCNSGKGYSGHLQEIHGECTSNSVKSLCRYSHFFLSIQPLEIFVDDETKLTLHGLQQHYVKLEEVGKNRKLNELLDSLEFNQVTRSFIPYTCQLF